MPLRPPVRRVARLTGGLNGFVRDSNPLWAIGHWLLVMAIGLVCWCVGEVVEWWGGAAAVLVGWQVLGHVGTDHEWPSPVTI